MFSKKATKIDKSSPSIWHLFSKGQNNGEDFVNFVAFLENINFNAPNFTVLPYNENRMVSENQIFLTKAWIDTYSFNSNLILKFSWYGMVR